MHSFAALSIFEFDYFNVRVAEGVAFDPHDFNVQCPGGSDEVTKLRH